ncbi:MAG TPA: radical SAM protein [Clostridia bacterium]|nr:radical SAM protein [Clostridia bacterium]
MEDYNNNSSPLSVCWNITSVCNDNCEFCYRNSNSKILSLEENKTILRKLIKSGVKKISLIGGEPLLYDGLFDLIMLAHEAGVVTSLTTNGILLDKEILTILDKCLDWLTLSLDASNEQLQTRLTRNENHFEKNISLLEIIKSNNYSVNIKINTLVTKINKHDVPNITNIIREYNVKRWKIFRFFPIRGQAIENISKFNITDDDYNRMRKEVTLMRRFIKGCNICFADKDTLKDSYFLLFSDGTVMNSCNEQDVIVGNLLSDEIADIWSKEYFNKSRHIEVHDWLINE